LIDLKTDFLQTEANFDTASNVYMLASNAAHHDYKREQCRLDGLYKDAIQQVSLGGGTVDATYYDNGTSSVSVQVCFEGKTPILMHDWSSKAIRDIIVGDRVKARKHDDSSSPVGDYKVVRVFKNVKDTWTVTFATVSGEEFQIRGTAEHPFWLKDKGWTPLGELKENDQCVSAAGKTVYIKSKRQHPEPIEVYNFEVEEAHTYFVGDAVARAVLVHNECPKYVNEILGDDLGKSIKNLYLNRASYGVLFVGQIFTRITQYGAFEFLDDGHVEAASEKVRKRFLKEYAIQHGAKSDGQWWVVKIRDWISVYKTLPTDGNTFTLDIDEGVSVLDQPSFWLGSMGDFEVNGTYEIKLVQDKEDPKLFHPEIRKSQMRWRWVDRIDANSGLQYDWKRNSMAQGIIETTLGDLIGDKLLGASFDIHVNFGD
jgi:Protein of unknown function (DUF1557).